MPTRRMAEALVEAPATPRIRETLVISPSPSAQHGGPRCAALDVAVPGGPDRAPTCQPGPDPGQARPASPCLQSTWARCRPRRPPPARPDDPPGPQRMAVWWPAQYWSRTSRLYSLPVGRRGSSSTKSTVRGHLKWARWARQKAISSCASSGPAAGWVDRLDHGLDLLAEVLVGDADHRHVQDGGVGREQVLGLLRVDVDPARDDHVALAVGQVEPTLVVDVADVANGAGLAIGTAVFGRLHGIVEVLEVGGTAEPDRAVRTGRALLSVLVEDQQLPDQAAADRARMGQPIVCSRRR